ncbi:MAG TPA: sulfatase-like hydrolase/transferase [Planctomycetota bacterium]|nr:sulfatase-like hydrolase/transferase [Planctomycetota bacterium]
MDSPSKPSFIRALIATKLENLTLVAAILVAFFAVGSAIAKFDAVSHAFQGEPLLIRLNMLLQAMPYDFLVAGVLLAVDALARSLKAPGPRLRVAALTLMYSALAACLVATFINVEVFKALGSPVKYHLLLLAPRVAKDLLRSGVSDKAAGLMLALGLLAVAFVLSGLICGWVRSHFQARSRWSLVPWVFACALLGTGLALTAKPPQGFRETALRELNLISMLAPYSAQARSPLAPPSELEKQILSAVSGPVDHSGHAAFSALPRAKHNIVLWVWESVGERYLKSLHTLGEAVTPNLDAMIKAGSVRFSQCYVECPLTVQTGWTLMTGQSPPARANIFTSGDPLPPHGQTLPAIFKQNGYRTARFNSGKTEIWNVKRVLGMPGFDINEDSDNLENRARFEANNWGIEDRALIDRFSGWIDSQAAGEPFYAMLWNVDTHHPYVWPGMPEPLRQAKEKARYIASIQRSDALLGELQKALIKRGIDKNTLIVIVGDHGEGHGRSPGRPYERAHSMLVFEDSIHVPLIFVHPAFNGTAHQVNTVCTVADLFPTLLEVCGITPPERLPGAALSKPFQPRPVYSRSILWFPMCSRLGPYKLLLETPEGKPQLYDIPKDPSEQNNLAEQKVDITNALMCDLIRMSEKRYQSDASFKYHFFSTGQDQETAPDLNKLLRPSVENK